MLMHKDHCKSLRTIEIIKLIASTVMEVMEVRQYMVAEDSSINILEDSNRIIRSFLGLIQVMLRRVPRMLTAKMKVPF